MSYWVQPYPEGYRLRLHVQPNARRTEIAGHFGDALKIRLAAPPVDGKANARLISYLAEVFAIPKRQVILISGEASRDKVVAVIGSSIPPERLLQP